MKPVFFYHDLVATTGVPDLPFAGQKNWKIKKTEKKKLKKGSHSDAITVPVMQIHTILFYKTRKLYFRIMPKKTCTEFTTNLSNVP